MGHYRSEMVSEEDDKKEMERRKKTKLRIINNLTKAIEKDGIASVLAELIEDDIGFRLRYREQSSLIQDSSAGRAPDC